MNAASLTALAGSIPTLPGNLAKVRVICELARRLESTPETLSVLDVGCAGPTPFNQWRSLFTRYPGRIRLTGIDVRGLDRARRMAQEMGWPVELLPLSAYHMADELAREFDVVVATQVLEHIRRPRAFMEQLVRVLRAGAPAYLTLDSGHFHGHRGLKERLRDLLAPLLGEHYHDVGLTAEELRRLTAESGLVMRELRYYNLHSLKRIHNHEVEPVRQDLFLRHWYELEEVLNEDSSFLERHRSYFAGIYVKAVRPSGGQGLPE